MNTILHANAISNNSTAVEITPGWVFGGAHRTMPLATLIDEDEPERASDVAVQSIQLTPDADSLVHVYVNDGLALTLTPAEARTLAAMLNLSAGEVDGCGPDLGSVSARPSLRIA